MTRPAVIESYDDATFRRVAIESWSLLDTFMSNDPTCKTIADPAERVRAICAIHGEFMRPAWRDMRALLGQPVVTD